MASEAFQARLKRGLVLRLTLDSSVLDDPAITTREKFVVILNHFCPDDPLYFVMATSKTGRFANLPHLSPETLSLDPAAYSFLDRPTVLDFTAIKSMALIDLTTLASKAHAHIVGELREEDLARCDEIIRRSRFIEPRVTPLILPGGYF